ncbi:MAG TPA: serine/threonine-protein kinase [Kofleriaceae bacterium]|nr:serine/threonine-protein kinase [Kofleriaceae bacterium]
MKGSLVAIGALLLVGGGAALGYGVTRKPTGGMSPAAEQAMTSAVDRLDSDVKAASASVKERVATLSTLLQVRAAVGTSPDTAKDMLARGELQFAPQAGEVVELGQLPSPDKPITLLIQPDGAMHAPHAGMIGSFTDVVDTKLVITEVTAVMSADPKRPSGYLSVTRPLDLAPQIKSLAAAGINGRIAIGDQMLDIGSPQAGAQTIEKSLPSSPNIKVTAAVPPKTGGMPMPLVAGGGIAAGLGLLLVVLGMMTKSSAAAASTQPQSQPQPQPSGLGGAATQLSTPGVAAGTPSPIDAGSSMISPTNLGPGAMVGRWEVIKRLGSGGMADVFLARARGDAGFEKTVAVKVMHPHLARNQRAVDHFLDEARLAARITHPNVVQILDLGKIGNDYVIVMEFVEGVDLERLLASARAAERPVPIDVGLGILCRICDGLNAAHKALAPDGSPLNIVHRDVKSANVLVSRQGGVKVVDFGIAKAAQQSHNTVAGETKGTPSMMAPEQRVGEQVDVRADVYSVAAVGFEILTGHGVNLDLAALAHLGVENWPHLPLPSSLRPQLPPELDGLLLGAMSFDRTKRPDDCTVLEAALEAIMKKHAMVCSDKDIARWVTSEMSALASGPGTEATLSPSVR